MSATATPQEPPSPPAGAAAQHAALGLHARGPISVRPEHPEAQWFGEAGLGLMVHWGLASVHGGIDLSWGMMANTPWDAAGAPSNKITPAEYWKLEERFRPQSYDPDRWLKEAKAAGFRYAVLTTMHHDGYTLWPSAHSAFGVQSGDGGRDLVGPFLEACRRHGIKAGIYLSPPDWHFDRKHMSFNYPSFAGRAALREAVGFPDLDEHHRPATIPPPSPEHLAKRREIFHARITELLTRYGRIDLLWFDGGTWDEEARDLALSLQPHLVVNSRIFKGHFESTECCLPKTRPASGTWIETCHCWQSCEILSPKGVPADVWGYLSTETYKTSAWMLSALGRLRSWGGNFLVNVGPRPDGSLPEIVYERFAEVAAWMAHSAAAVLDVAPAPAPDPCELPVTVGKGRWFVHFPPRGEEPGTVRIRLPFEPGPARLLRDGSAVDLVPQGEEWKISLDETRRSGSVDIVEIAMPEVSALRSPAQSHATS